MGLLTRLLTSRGASEVSFNGHSGINPETARWLQAWVERMREMEAGSASDTSGFVSGGNATAAFTFTCSGLPVTSLRLELVRRPSAAEWAAFAGFVQSQVSEKWTGELKRLKLIRRERKSRTVSSTLPKVSPMPTHKSEPNASDGDDTTRPLFPAMSAASDGISASPTATPENQCRGCGETNCLKIGCLRAAAAFTR